MNLRILVYLNPSNINKITHKFELSGDSGFVFVKESILALNKIVDWHFYVLVPEKGCWKNPPKNVTLVEYPYINDALNSRFHFDTNALNEYFNTYRHDIDAIWTMLPETVAPLKGFANKRREEIPVFTYVAWMDYKETKGYEPSYKFRMLEGIHNSDIFAIQSAHMKTTMSNILDEFSYPDGHIKIIHPKTKMIDCSVRVGDVIGFPHRISTESYFMEMFPLIKDTLKYPLWVSNLNNQVVPEHPMLVNNFIEDREDYYKHLCNLRFGVSYHIGYSMWSMSVLDMMACGKCVLVPRKNAFIEMFDEDYPFFFDDAVDFKEKFEYLQNISDDELVKWGKRNQEIIKQRFTWDIQAEELKEIFLGMMKIPANEKTDSVLNIIKQKNAISKGELINKNVTDFGRRCSRAWNKTRLDLMFNHEVKDDITSEYTIFYLDGDRYKKHGQQFVENIPTPYALKNKLESNTFF